MKSPDLAIQIVNYKSKAFLDPLLTSIINDISTLDCAIEINILDNASGDDLSDIGAKWKKHNVHVYTSKTNGGFGAGHNLLAHKTAAPYLLILNPDILLIESHTIQRLLKSLEQHNATAVGPRLQNPKTRSYTLGQPLASRQLKQQIWDYGTFTVFWRYKTLHAPQEVEWVSGGVTLINRGAFDAIGGFDERYFLYYEDLDLCDRLHRSGGRIVYDPTIQVLHYGSASTKGNGKYRHLMRSFLQYQRNRRKQRLNRTSP